MKKIRSLSELKSKTDSILKLFGVDASKDTFETVKIAMVGATSVGKSYTINALMGRELCKVGHIGNTTRQAGWNPVRLTDNSQPDMMLLDLPGWGISKKVDDYYRNVLSEHLPKTNAVLWILRADALGTLAYDLDWIVNVVLPAIHYDVNKLVIGINQVENVYDYAFRTAGKLSPIQVETINKKCQLVYEESVHEISGLKQHQIHPYSAAKIWRLWPLLYALVRSAGDYGWILELISHITEEKNVVYG